MNFCIDLIKKKKILNIIDETIIVIIIIGSIFIIKQIFVFTGTKNFEIFIN